MFEFGSTKSQRQINTANSDVRNKIKTILAFSHCKHISPCFQSRILSFLVNHLLWITLEDGKWNHNKTALVPLVKPLLEILWDFFLFLSRRRFSTGVHIDVKRLMVFNLLLSTKYSSNEFSGCCLQGALAR